MADLFAEAGLDDVDNIVAEFLQLVDDVDVQRADGVVVLVVVDGRDVLVLQPLAQLVDVVLYAEGLADVAAARSGEG